MEIIPKLILCVNNIDSNKTDYELILDTLEDLNKYKHIIKRYSSKLQNYIRGSIMCSKEDSEDILQEVFINVYRNLNNYDSEFKFSSWIYRIAHNEAINFVRKNHNKVVGLDEKISEVLSDDIKLEDIVFEKLDADSLKILIETLDQKYRDILILRYYEDYEYQEISDILKISVGNVGSLINRAKNILKSKLNHE